jgi:hypothetical protein
MPSPEPHQVGETNEWIWIETPLDIVRNAQEHFIFNCLLADAIGHKLITPASFRPEIQIHTGGPGLTIRKACPEAAWKPLVRELI